MTIMDKIKPLVALKRKKKDYIIVLGDVAYIDFVNICQATQLYPSGDTPVHQYYFHEIPVICSYLGQGRNEIRLYRRAV